MGVTPLPTEAEIGVLEALAAEGETLAAKAKAGAAPFRTRLRLVDPGRRFLLLERSGDEAADAVLLGRPRVELLVEWGEWRIGFSAGRPEAVVHEGASLLRTEFPASVSISRRRMLPRTDVPREAPIRCVARPGATPAFEAEVIDVSEGGIGMQADPGATGLEPGVLLAACRLERPGREPEVVDLEVRHTSRVKLEDGRLVLRVGCRFASLSPAAMRLTAEYAGSRPDR